MKPPICLFGSAEKGTFCVPIMIDSLVPLLDKLGHPPLETAGINYAIQSLLFKERLMYFRVSEEGYSINDYMTGLKWIKKTSPEISAICLPGASDPEILHATLAVCNKLQCPLLMSEKDLYDYLTVK